MSKDFLETLHVYGGFSGGFYDLNQGPLIADIIDARLQDSGILASLQENAPIGLQSTGTLGAARNLSLTLVEDAGRIFYLHIANSDIATNSLTLTPTNVINGLSDIVISNVGDFWLICLGSGSWQIGRLWEPSERNNLELEMAFQASQLLYYKKLAYTGNKLTLVSIYTDNTEIVQLFNKALSYTGNNLVQVVLTRVADGATVTKTLAYTGNNLTSITRT